MPSATTPPLETTTTLAPSSNLDDATTWSWTATSTGGYTEDASLQVGAAEQFSSGITNGPDTAGSACSLDTTDAVLPFTLSVSNTSAGNFSEYSYGLYRRSWLGQHVINRAQIGRHLLRSGQRDGAYLL